MPQVLPEHDDIIRARAYQFWLEEGRPHGRHDIHWQRALASVAATLVPEAKPFAVASAAKAGVVTDVSLIGGIGPKIKEQLAKAGLAALSDIAALTPAALAALDAKLGWKGRSAREAWIAQAKDLIAGKAPRAKIDKARAAGR